MKNKKMPPANKAIRNNYLRHEIENSKQLIYAEERFKQ